MQQNASTTPLPLLKISEAAKVLNLSVRATRTLIDLGKLPSVRVSQRCVRIDPADLQRYIDSRRSR